MELKALKILKNSKVFKEHSIVELHITNFVTAIMEKELEEINEAIAELEELELLQKEAIKILNNVLYFGDNSDYRAALVDVLSKLSETNKNIYAIKDLIK